MRLEKAYRGGHELANDVSPVHSGQMRLVNPDKQFIGRDAVLRRVETGESSTLVYLELAAADCDALGGEAVYRDGRVVGSWPSRVEPGSTKITAEIEALLASQ